MFTRIVRAHKVPHSIKNGFGPFVIWMSGLIKCLLDFILFFHFRFPNEDSDTWNVLWTPLVTVREPIFGTSQYSAPMSNVLLWSNPPINWLIYFSHNLWETKTCKLQCWSFGVSYWFQLKWNACCSLADMRLTFPNGHMFSMILKAQFRRLVSEYSLMTQMALLRINLINVMCLQFWGSCT